MSIDLTPCSAAALQLCALVLLGLLMVSLMVFVSPFPRRWLLLYVGAVGSNDRKSSEEKNVIEASLFHVSHVKAG